MTPPVSTTSGSHRRVRSGLCVGAAAALLVTLTGPAATADDAEAATTAAQSAVHLSSPTGAYFIEFAPKPTTTGGSTASIERAQRTFVAEAESAGVELEVRHEFSTLWSGISADMDEDAAEVVADLPQVKAIYPVLPVEAPARPVSEPELLSALSMTGADIAQSELGFTGEGIRVGIIDTGVDYDHPDFGGAGVDGETTFPSEKVVAGYDFVGDDYNSDPEDPNYQPVPMPDGDPDDCNGHGTHVAGIVGADGDTTAGGVRGVAPGVELGAYRVFGCEGSTESDIMVAAMEKALDDGMDVVNQSIGSAFSTWPQYPTAVASDNLVDAGVVMVASIGNSGASGTWSAGAPGVGEDVIGVASFDNVSVTAPVIEIDGAEYPYFSATGSPEPPTEGSLPLARLGDPGTAAARACPDISADLSGQAVLIERGADPNEPDPTNPACDASFYAKALKAQNAGAAAVVIYNNVPGLINPTVAGATPITIPVISISQEAGLAADAAVVDGGATLTWTDEVGSTPNATGGLISSFSSYGLAADLTVKPDLGAPGGNIYSTYPLEEGEYSTISGTSMAAPHVAGAAALLLQARPDTEAHDVRDLLLNSADPAVWNGEPTGDFLEAVHRQGAGMLDIDDAILSTVTVTPGKLSLGESEHGPVTETLTVENHGDEDVTYELSSLDAAATTGNPDAPTVVKDATARVVMADEVTVPAGGETTVDVTISPNELEQALYGGYVVLTPKDGDGASLSVPFAGFAGDYQALPLLENLGTTDLPALGQIAECDRFIGIDCAAGGGWNLADTGGTTYTMADGDVPTVLIHLENPAQSLTFSIYRPMPEGASAQAIEGQAIARYEQHIGRDSGTFTAWTWDGTRTTRDGGRAAVPDGHYILQVEALSALGDPDNPDHVQKWSTPSFIIDRDGDGEVPPLEPEEPQPQPQPGPQQYGFFLNDGWDGKPEHVFQYGRHTDEVLIGDWDGDGRDTITVRRENRFYVSNAPRGGDAETVFTYGRPGDVVLVGDWNGDGTDTLAVRRGSTYHVKNSLRGGEPDHVITYGRVSDAIMVGDWDGNGNDTFAVRRGSTYYVKNSMRGGDADRTFTYGREADVTLAGDWDGNGTDTFAVRRGNAYFVKNSLAGGDADFSVKFGRAGDEVLVGDWNGDGRDTLGVRRTPSETAEPNS